MANLDWTERAKREEEREKAELDRRERKKERSRQMEEESLTRVEGRRWEFRFKEVSVDDIGVDGRGERATGYRYGAPLLDRKRAQIKIPRRVL